MRRIDLFLLLALLLTFFLNLHYISGLYYDHDISSYTYDTLQILEGKPFYYAPTWNAKPPGINFIFLLAFSIFGKSFISIQICSLFANLLSVIFLYFLAKYILQKEIRFYFLLPLFYALFSVSEAIQGHSSNLETFLNPFEIAGILFLGLAAKNKKSIFYIISGFLLGSGFLIKQSAIATFIAGLVFIFAIKILYKENFRSFLKRTLFFAFMFLLPILLISMYFLCLGVWRNFIECVFIKNIEYIKNISTIRNIYMLWAMQQMWKMLKIEIIIFGSLALIGMFYSFLRYKRPERILVLLWFIIPTLIISRGGFHFRHHFIEIIAPLLTFSVIGLSDIYNTGLLFFQQRRFLKRIFVVLGICILAFPAFHIIIPLIKKNKLANSFFLTQRYLDSINKNKYIQMLLRESPDAARRFLISQYVKEHTTEKDKIFVWDDIGGGSIYLWTERDNITDFKTKYPLLQKKLKKPIVAIIRGESDDYRFNQRALLQEITFKRPVYIVVVQSRLPMPNAPFSPSEMLSLEKEAFKEFFDLLEKDYQLESEIMGCQAYRLVQKNSDNIK